MVKVTSANDIQQLFHTIKAIETLDDLITYYSLDVPSPAYLKVKYAMNEPELQLNRDIILPALRAQRKIYVDYLTNAGIEYTRNETED